MNHSAPLLFLGIAMFVAGCAANSPPQRTRIDEVPMYGGIDRSAYPDLKAGDEKFIADVSRVWGSRENAAMAWVDQGYRFYYQDDLALAMRRFNQAWLLDPGNPEVYWCFASVLHDQGYNCERMRMIDLALDRNPPTQKGFFPDAGRIVALCAISDPNLTDKAKSDLLNRSEDLFRKAEQVEPDKGYVYSTWATAYYWRGQYRDAWSMVAQSRAARGSNTKQFLDPLRAKMREPSD
jgi:tetratricopeptide (TPR) repeat protein